MKTSKRFRNSLAWLAASLVLLAAPAFAQNRYILATTTAADQARVISQYGLTVLRSIHGGNDIVDLVSLPPGASRQTVAAILADQAVRALTPDSPLEGPEPIAPQPSRALDPLSDALAIKGTQIYYGAPVRAGYVAQTAAGLIHLPQTQQQFPAGNIIVAVIDTGVDRNHPALSSVLVPGYDFLNDVPGIPSELAGLSQSTVAILDQSTVAILDGKNSPLVLNQSTVAILDQSTVAILDGTKLPAAFGHGTMVSGLIHLVAPTAQIMPLKAFQLDGTANLSDVIRAIYYAVDHNAKVINMSFSTAEDSLALQNAVKYAVSRGLILVAAAGNDGKEAALYPAGYDAVFGVASTDKIDMRSPFSNWGAVSRLGAPGEALLTTYPGNNYAAVWGTSFSAALASGAAAVITGFRPSIRSDQMKDVLNQGPHLDGYPRLDLLPSMLYCTLQNY